MRLSKCEPKIICACFRMYPSPHLPREAEARATVSTGIHSHTLWSQGRDLRVTTIAEESHQANQFPERCSTRDTTVSITLSFNRRADITAPSAGQRRSKKKTKLSGHSCFKGNSLHLICRHCFQVSINPSPLRESSIRDEIYGICTALCGGMRCELKLSGVGAPPLSVQIAVIP